MICGALAAVSLLLPSTPTYDVWAWLVWGREVAELNLRTQSGPSWKPLPVLFTTLFSFAGGAAPALWLVIARTGGLVAVVLTYRLAVRLTGGRRPAFAGLAACGILLSSGLLVGRSALGESEGLLLALVLWGVLRHLDRMPFQAFGLGLAAAMLRPETWPFLGLYACFLWVKVPGRRVATAGLLLLIPLAWFLPDYLSSGNPLGASSRALMPDPGSASLADRPAHEVVRRAFALLPPGASILALGGLVVATVRREAPLIMLAAGGAAWIALNAVMAEFGFPGAARILLLGVAAAAVLGGVALARIVERAPRVLSWLLYGLTVVLFAAHISPGVLPLLTTLEEEARYNRNLATIITEAGGRDVLLACGRPIAPPLAVPSVAWHLRTAIADVGLIPESSSVVFRYREFPPIPPDAPSFQRIATLDGHEVLTACREESGQASTASQSGESGY
jgi:hypothetical protein